MEDSTIKAKETAEFITQHTGMKYDIGVFTGTGLSDIAHRIDVVQTFEYKNIPHFPISTVISHTGRLVCGRWGRKSIIVLQGRFHLYEGYSPAEVVFPVRVMQELGVRTLFVTNAAGGFNSEFFPGDIMIIEDHINLTGENPLIGPNNDAWGPRFPDMSSVYDPQLISFAKEAGKTRHIRTRTGVYAGLKGPSLETPAEIRFLRLIGADAVGFSTMQEVIAGVHAGMRIIGLSTITNVHNPDDPQPSTVEEIIDVANEAAPKLSIMIEYILEKLDA